MIENEIIIQVPEKIKQKRGRKPKNYIPPEITEPIAEKPPAKKRGRKPKGGKIIQQNAIMHINTMPIKPNIILHLKCSIKDLETYNKNTNIKSYNYSENVFNVNNQCTNVNSQKVITQINNNNNNNNNTHILTNTNNSIKCNDTHNDTHNDTKNINTQNNKIIWKKLKQLEYQLHKNISCDKKVACFWCTYYFENPVIYIPKYFMNDAYHVYGCFCTPECAAAHLMSENIDTSTKFERYYLLNYIYSKIFNNNVNIKPAPNPYYMLEKFYGNLTIDEYRALLSSKHLFSIVDKPLTRVLPELHEDNEDFMINNKSIKSTLSL